MVRIDKILYMITCFKIESSLLEQYQYSKPPKNLIFSDDSILVLKRLGAISDQSFDNNDYEQLIRYVPLGRERFLLENISKHSQIVCIADNPKCSICQMSKQCDYNNRANDWKELN